MLKLQVKQLGVKNTILNALHHKDDTIEYDYNTILRVLLVFPVRIQKALKYYKKSCHQGKTSIRRKKHHQQQLLMMEIKVKYHVISNVN